jgi:uracil-DNA glycosylase
MLSERQKHCLAGIGIPVWRERCEGDFAEDGALARSVPEATVGDGLDVSESPTRSVPGITLKDDVDVSGAPARSVPDGSAADAPDVNEASARPVSEDTKVEPVTPERLDSWDGVIAAIHGCEACELSKNCTQKVPGVGDRKADLLIVGEGPGHDEDIRGEPFVGRSGQLLDRMLAAIGISRDQVFITNIVKCRPPGNRDPKQDEASRCRAYLDAQIELISPKVILSVGRVSAHNLLGSSEPVGKLIKTMHRLPGSEIPLKVTYHPAYLLRNPSAKAIAWQDLKLLHRLLQ